MSSLVSIKVQHWSCKTVKTKLGRVWDICNNLGLIYFYFFGICSKLNQQVHLLLRPTQQNLEPLWTSFICKTLGCHHHQVYNNCSCLNRTVLYLIPALSTIIWTHPCHFPWHYAMSKHFKLPTALLHIHWLKLTGRKFINVPNCGL